jgi:hypothetical protein
MENSNTVVTWEGGDETNINLGAIIVQKNDPSLPDPETEAEEI